MNGEEFGEELYRENLYFVYEDKCRELEKELDKFRPFTSAYEMKKEIKRLNNIIKTKDEGIKAFTEDLCETAEELEKANNKMKMALDYIQDAKGKDINYVATLLLGYPIEISEMREQFLESIGSDK